MSLLRPDSWDGYWGCSKCGNKEPHVHIEPLGNGKVCYKDYGYDVRDETPKDEHNGKTNCS